MIGAKVRKKQRQNFLLQSLGYFLRGTKRI